MASVLFVTRVIGPTQYGIFASAYGILLYTAALGTWGIDVYLLRRPEEPLARDYNLGFTVLLCVSLFLGGLLALCHSLIASVLHFPALGPKLFVMALYLPLNLLALPGIVSLDRHLRFRTVALNELVSQIASVCVAVPLALMGAGAWAPTTGILVQQFMLLLMTSITSGFRPRLAWDLSAIRSMLGYGLSYSSSIWVYQLRMLVNPILVARFAGARAVGIVALGIRLTETLSFARNATWRIAMAALAKLGGRKDLLRRSIEEGMRLQALAAGLPLAIFALLAQTVFLPVFGHKWDAALRIFPFIAIGYLVNSMFNLHSSVLYLLQKNWEVTRFHFVHVLLFAGSVVLLVPRFGYGAYGYAEIIALLGYLLIHHYIKAEVGAPLYRHVFLWVALEIMAISMATASPQMRILAAIVLSCPLFFPKERAVLQGYFRLVRQKSQPA